MDLVELKVLNMSEIDPNSDGKIYSIAICISDLSERITEMYNAVTDTSWLSQLDVVDKMTYQARSKPTIDKVVNEILNNVETTVSVDFGEYMVSDTAQSALREYLQHFRLPLAELIKEKISGNPGFDFHTESPNAILAFGEAKYSGVQNAHSKALRQIKEFIIAKKDVQELGELRKFVTEIAIQNAANGKKSYCAAFSIVSEDIQAIMQNALDSNYLLELTCFETVFLIGVKVNA